MRVDTHILKVRVDLRNLLYSTTTSFMEAESLTYTRFTFD